MFHRGIIGLMGLLLLGACTPTAAPTAVPPTPTTVVAPPSASEAELCTTIEVIYHERPPYVITVDEGITGLSGSPTKFAFDQLGLPVTWSLTPTNRQLIILQENSGCYCSPGWFKNPDREKFARYSDPIYQDQPQIAITYADNPILQSGMTVEEALTNPDLTLGVKDGYSYGAFLDAKIAEFQPKKDVTTAENVNMLEKVHKKYNDYFFMAPEEADGLIALSTLPAADFRYVTFSDMPDGENRYIICSMRVQPEILTKLNEALASYVPEE